MAAGPMTPFIDGLRRWFGEAITHAFGDPREEKSHLPPKIGVQAYKHDPYRP